ncbi:hypothetical protein [Aquimarina sp. 2201CG14-23]|uniref:hypothetical protein n=1 Tax=Aquimarina mycalae TaxID=3040073 RepID=UPI002478248C|nr:hypothetical protein [Aquimarina sp. 2201CG14-23]MDH7445315.1 hypothetical protein [Aquimarina sp. 2201CG14-23]
MVILKKIRAATLIETLTASVLIIIVFMIASLSFNNIFTNHIKRDRSTIENRIKELEYLVIHEKIRLPYTEDFDSWEIEIISKNNKTIVLYNQGTISNEKQLILRD